MREVAKGGRECVVVKLVSIVESEFARCSGEAQRRELVQNGEESDSGDEAPRSSESAYRSYHCRFGGRV